MPNHDKDTDSREERLDQIIASYLRSKSTGEASSRQQWLRRYPEFADELARFFANEDRFDHAVKEPAELSTPATASSRGARAFGKPGRKEKGHSGIRTTAVMQSFPPDLKTDRYSVSRFVARGGMGEIWLAEDGRVNRKVAFKRLREKRDGDRERFVAEAQIAGQLEHPSIVPLYDLDADAEGRPFYVMKYVEGKTLKEALLEHHSPEQSIEPDSQSPAPREVGRVRLLEVFIDLCQAVAFAHSRGVLHRDLKPDNVMVGPFGETVLLDWGLAKVKAEPEHAAGAHYVEVSSSGGTDATRDGSVLGSPAYMAPETAEGRIHELDETTDVYLLGATLYEILTGRPPRQGASHLEMVELARTVEPTPPRKLNPSIPRALEAVCQKALARRMQDRYRSALELAEDVRRWLAGEPVSAYREPWAARTWRWCKKHRRLLSRAAMAGVVLAAALSAMAVHRENQRLQAVEQARAEVADFRRLAEEAAFYAVSSDPPGERAPYYDLQKGDATARVALAIAARWDDDLDRLPLPQKRPELRDELYDLLLLTVQERLAEGKGSASSSPEQLLGLLDRAASLHETTRSFYRLQAECYRRQDKPEQARQARRLMKDPRTPQTALDHFLLGETYRTESFSPLNPWLGEADRAANRRLLQRAVEQFRLALQKEPEHFWAHLQLGRSLLSLGHAGEAVEALGACIAARPQSPWGYSARAAALVQLGRYKQAEQELKRLLRNHPGFLPARLNLGRALHLSGELDEALVQYEKILSAPEEKRLLTAAYYRGELFLQQKRREAALAEFETVLSADPGFYPVYFTRAQVYLSQGQEDLALRDLDNYLFLISRDRLEDQSWQMHHRRGQLLRRLQTRIPASANKTEARVVRLMCNELQAAIDKGGSSAQLFHDLGAALALAGRPSQEIIDAYTEGLALVDEDDDELAIRLLLKRGWAHLRRLRETDAMRAAFRQFLRAATDSDGEISRILNSAREDFQAALRVNPDVPEAHTGLGYIDAIRRQQDAAEQNATEALLMVATVGDAIGTSSSDYLLLHNVACIYGQLSQTLPAQATELQDRAMAVLERAVRLWRSSGSGRPDLRQIILVEPAFPTSMRNRPDFQGLLNKNNE